MALGIVGGVGGAVGGMIYDAVNGNDFGTSIMTGMKIGFGGGAIAGAVIGSVLGGLAAASVSGMTNVILWSNLAGGAAAAEEIASSMSMTTLGQTFGGKCVSFISNIAGYNFTKYLWQSLSKTMASTLNMSSVMVFFSEAISETSIFWEYERPELLKKLIEIIWKNVGG